MYFLYTIWIFLVYAFISSRLYRRAKSNFIFDYRL